MLPNSYLRRANRFSSSSTTPLLTRSRAKIVRCTPARQVLPKAHGMRTIVRGNRITAKSCKIRLDKTYRNHGGKVVRFKLSRRRTRSPGLLHLRLNTNAQRKSRLSSKLRWRSARRSICCNVSRSTRSKFLPRPENNLNRIKCRRLMSSHENMIGKLSLQRTRFRSKSYRSLMIGCVAGRFSTK